MIVPVLISILLVALVRVTYDLLYATVSTSMATLLSLSRFDILPKVKYVVILVSFFMYLLFLKYYFPLYL